MENSNWINDVALEQNLRDYVWRNLKRKDILDFMKGEYEQLEHSDIRWKASLSWYRHSYTSLQTVQAVVQKELNGPSKFLGYRALNQKLRMHHEVQKPPNLVYKMLQYEDP